MNGIDDIFNLHDVPLTPLAGSLLVARPTVGDPCFGRSVILMVEHGERGSMGLIMNRLTNLTVGRILANLVEAPVDTGSTAQVFLGGPVQTDELLFVHDLGPDHVPECEAVGDTGLWISGDFATVKRLVSEGEESHFRFFVGYSGWEAGQLEGEMKRHDWAVLDGADAHFLLSTPYDRLWGETVQRFGERYRLWLNWPAEPGLN